MPVDQQARDALDLKNLKLPPGVSVVRLEAEDYTDWSGDPALRVLVVLDESVDVEKSMRELIGLKSSIHESLRSHGVALFPYIFLAKQSELDEIADDVDDDEE